MTRFLPKFSNNAVKRAIMWGLFIFYSVIIVAYYGLKMWKSTENFDVADVKTGNIVVLDSQYASTMPSTPLADIYSYTAEPSPIAAPVSKIMGNSGGSTSGASSMKGNVSLGTQ